MQLRYAAVLVCLSLAACKSSPQGRQIPFHGEIVALNEQGHIATIKHGKIGDWMEPMTMEYPIKDAADWKKLAVGEQIDATAFVNGSSYYVGNVRVTARPPG
jgi:Cu/Ag efflux protein CusF